MPTSWYISYFNRSGEANRQKRWKSVGDKELNRIEKLLDLEPGMSVLDLACGIGRYAIAFASKGYKVTAMDISEPCVALAQTQAYEQGLEIHFAIRDMRNIEYGKIFNAIYCLNSSFGFLESDTEHLQVLTAVRKALKPKGKVLLDLINRDALLKNLSMSGGRIDGYKGEDCYFDCVTGTLVSKQFLHEDSRSIVTTLRLFTIPELKLLMEKAGMVVTGVYGGYGQQNLTLASKNLIIVGEINTA